MQIGCYWSLALIWNGILSGIPVLELVKAETEINNTRIPGELRLDSLNPLKNKAVLLFHVQISVLFELEVVVLRV